MPTIQPNKPRTKEWWECADEVLYDILALQPKPPRPVPPEPQIDLSDDLVFHRLGVETFKKWLAPMIARFG